MRSTFRSAVTAIVLALALPPAHSRRADVAAAPGRLRELTPEAVRSRVTLTDDALETNATLTTRTVYREARGLLGATPFDAFLRAFVDKRSGATSFQVYATVRYTALVWTRFDTANYLTAAGPRSVELDQIARVRGRCWRYAGCERLETVGFAVDEAVLRAAAAAYRPGETAPWPFRLKSRTGVERTDGLAAAEIAGLLLAVDDYRARIRAPR